MQTILSQTASLPENAFAPGDVLLREGDQGGVLFILLEGTVSVIKGQTEVARVSNPGAIFGEMSVLLRQPISANVIAQTPVRARVCDNALGFLSQSPEIALHTARLLASRLHCATSYLADIKAQYQDRSDHFGMVDRVLDAMVEQQPSGMTLTDNERDPRL